MSLNDKIREAMIKGMTTDLDRELFEGKSNHDSPGVIDLPPFVGLYDDKGDQITPPPAKNGQIIMTCPEDVKPGVVQLNGKSYALKNGDTLTIEMDDAIVTLPPPRIRDLFPSVTVAGNGPITFPTRTTNPPAPGKAVTNDRQINDTLNTIYVLVEKAPSALIRQALKEQIDQLSEERLLRTQHDQKTDHPIHDVRVGDLEGCLKAIAEADKSLFERNQIAFRVEMQYLSSGLILHPNDFIKLTDI